MKKMLKVIRGVSLQRKSAEEDTSMESLMSKYSEGANGVSPLARSDTVDPAMAGIAASDRARGMTGSRSPEPAIPEGIFKSGTFQEDFGDFLASEDDEPVFEDLSVILKRIAGAAEANRQRGSAAHSAATPSPNPNSFNSSSYSLSRMQRCLNITPSQWEGMHAWLNDESDESTVDVPEPERHVYRTTPYVNPCASGRTQTSSGQASSEQRCAQSCALLLTPQGRHAAKVLVEQLNRKGDCEPRVLRPVVGVFRRLGAPE
ncbi:hypothetical protein T484DRAFT_1823390 [Baffinella frigidus]|nr:hypothetical protein T484DRAFT_1823390 [Cryptophyta sp. CCMP2293]